jgi:heat shock protein HspQ
MNRDCVHRNFKWDIGQIVHHKRYHYRGVVYRRDPCCKAEDDWYYTNKTQPDREQPWYHVLVDGAAHTTYVAECNLEPDSSGDPIQHPALERHFRFYSAGKYHQDILN